MSSATPEMFRFDRERAAADLSGPEETLWPVNAYSDADELNQLLEAAQAAGLVSSGPPGHLFVYPLSVCEPDPLLAASLANGPTLLGHGLKLREREGEDPIAFTLRLLEDLVAEANGLLGQFACDRACLDRIAEFLNRPGQWNGGGVCEFVATELQRSGREILDNADD